MRFPKVGPVCVLSMLFVQLSSGAQEQSRSPSRNSALTNQDIVLMAKSQFDDPTIEKMIETHETNFDLSVSALVKLKEAGVTQGVIQAMLATTGSHIETISTRSSAPAPSKSSAGNSDGSLSREQQAQQLQPGTYYWSRGSWRSMEPLTMSGGGTKHMAKMFVPGLTPQMVWTFREPSAPVQISESQPLFCARFIAMPPGMPYAPSARNIAIVRFDEKKDHRELQITSGGNMLTFKSGISKDRLPDLTVTSVDATTALFTPSAPLRAGEYIISTSSLGLSGYDFGFHPEH